MRSVHPFANLSPANFRQPKPVSFKGQLIDEVDSKSRKKMELIDKFVRTEQLTEKEKYAHKDYLRDYSELNDDLQYGVDKKEVTGLMNISIAQMWQKIPDKYKQVFEQFQQSHGEPPPLRRYSSSRLSQMQSAVPETIIEE